MKNLTLCVVYRTGTPDNFVWHRSGRGDKEGADNLIKAFRPIGNVPFIQDYQESIDCGVPNTFHRYGIIKRFFLWIFTK